MPTSFYLVAFKSSGESRSCLPHPQRAIIYMPIKLKLNSYPSILTTAELSRLSLNYAGMEDIGYFRMSKSKATSTVGVAYHEVYMLAKDMKIPAECPKPLHTVAQ
jgi:hypothetical protein